MTVRVAVEHFAMGLRVTGLGNDETGKAICAGYLERVKEIQKLMGLK